MTRWYIVGDGPSPFSPAVYTENNPAAVEHGRPVVVIDPEDREQVERLAERIGHLWKSHDYVRDVVQAALREFANPTPPEPTGLGAVVEDADGTRWMRIAGPNVRFAWRPEGAQTHYGDNRYWVKVAAVRVLSEGVPS